MFEIIRCLIADTDILIQEKLIETSCNHIIRNSKFSQPPTNNIDNKDINGNTSIIHQNQSYCVVWKENISYSYFPTSEKSQQTKWFGTGECRLADEVWCFIKGILEEILHILMTLQAKKFL
jgi:hypothetical protein